MPEWKIDSTNLSDVKAVSALPYSHRMIVKPYPNATRTYMASETYDNSPRFYHPEPNLLPTTCNCGCGWKKQDEIFCKGTYYAATFKKNVLVYFRRCLKNACSWHYDGQEQGVFNFSGHTLVSYIILQDFEVSCVKNAMSWSAFREKVKDLYNEIYSMTEDEMTFMSEPTLVQVCSFIFL